MGQYTAATVDFDAAKEIVTKIKVQIDKIRDLTERGTKAVDASLETNNMTTLLNVQGGFKMMLSKVTEIVDVPDEILRAIDSYEEMYNSEIDDASKTQNIF